VYKILCDGALICDSRIEELALVGPVVNPEENKAGSFSFTLLPDHPKYDAVIRRYSEVQVYIDDELLFGGECVEVEIDFYKQKKIYCEGDFAFFNDSVQRPAKYNSVQIKTLLEALVNIHNQQVEDRKRFTVGIVTVNGYATCYTNMENTMYCLNKCLVEPLGGFMRVRYENGVKYLDYLADSINTNSQTIQLGKNLLDFKSNIDTRDVATMVIPLGATIEGTEANDLELKLTIDSVNNGKDYLVNEEAVKACGTITKVIEFPEETDASLLKAKAEKYLQDMQFESVVIEAKAIDLHMVEKDAEPFRLGDRIRVLSPAHGMDRYFRATKVSYHLDSPESNQITLGKTEFAKMSAQANRIQTQIKEESSQALLRAVENATALITSAMGGYVVKTNEELLIMDTDKPETSTRVWRWNINGLGYSENGYNGPYALAMTMDGAIVADFITAGTMSCDRLNGGKIKGQHIEGGTIKIGDTFSVKEGQVDISGAINVTEGGKIGDWVVANIGNTNTCGLQHLVKNEANGNYDGIAISPYGLYLLISDTADAKFIFWEDLFRAILGDNY
jgi:hypothetical protein